MNFLPRTSDAFYIYIFFWMVGLGGFGGVGVGRNNVLSPVFFFDSVVLMLRYERFFLELETLLMLRCELSS